MFCKGEQTGQHACSKGCTTFSYRDGIKYVFYISHEKNNNIDIIHRLNPSRFDFNLVDLKNPSFLINPPLLTLLIDDIPKNIDNTYNLSKYLISFVPRIKKLKNFI